MSTLAIVLSSLTGTSLLVALALAIAWQRFGRAPHAALWASGFAASGAAHLMQLVREVVPATAAVTTLLTVNCLMVSLALLALGFRCRAGLAARVPLVIGATMLVASAVAAAGIAFADPRWPRVAVNLVGVAALTLSALAVRDDGSGAHVPSVATTRMLFGYAGFCALLAAIALAVTPGGPVTPALFRFLALVGAPAGMVAVGLSTLLLLGGDLAERLYRLAESDPLTGLLNRRGVERAATRLVAQAARSGRALSVVVADLDRFKAINDSYGHALGDVVLRRFAAHATNAMRAGDVVGRFGGEEFVFVLTDATAGRAGEGDGPAARRPARCARRSRGAGRADRELRHRRARRSRRHARRDDRARRRGALSLEGLRPRPHHLRAAARPDDRVRTALPGSVAARRRRARGARARRPLSRRARPIRSPRAYARPSSP